MEELLKAYDLIENNPDSDFEGKKDKKLILKAQEILGLTFPPSYFDFLQNYGCGDAGGFEIYGIINDNFEKNSVPDAIGVTLSERKINNLDSHLIIVAASDEYFYCIDTSIKNSDNESPVREILPNLNICDCNVVADSFGKFLFNMLNNFS